MYHVKATTNENENNDNYFHKTNEGIQFASLFRDQKLKDKLFHMMLNLKWNN